MLLHKSIQSYLPHQFVCFLCFFWRGYIDKFELFMCKVSQKCCTVYDVDSVQKVHQHTTWEWMWWWTGGGSADIHVHTDTCVHTYVSAWSCKRMQFASPIAQAMERVQVFACWSLLPWLQGVREQHHSRWQDENSDKNRLKAEKANSQTAKQSEK